MAAADLGASIELILEDDPNISLSELDKKLNGPPPKRKTNKKKKKEWRTYPRPSIAAELEKLRSVKPIPLERLAAEMVELNDEIVSYMADIKLYGEKYEKDVSMHYYAIRKLQMDKGIELHGKLKMLILKYQGHGSAAEKVIAKLTSQVQNFEEIDKVIETEWENLARTEPGKKIRAKVTLNELTKTELKASFTHFVL